MRDESNKEGVRIVVELKKDAFPKKILNQLFSHTQLQTTFHFNMLALIDNGIQPRILNLKTILEEKLGITKVRGKWYTAKVDYMTDPLYIMPLFHPSYLLRNASKDVGAPKWLTWQDFKEVKKAMEFYDLEKTTDQR